MADGVDEARACLGVKNIVPNVSAVVFRREALLAAAHAGCFSMALSSVLEKAGFTAESIQTRAEVTMEPGMEPGPTVTGVNLVVNAKVPGISPEEFEEIAESAKAGCVISRALAVPVSMTAMLVS